MSSPPRTRSSSKSEDNLIDQLSSKMEEMKLVIISELKSEIASEINRLLISQQELINNLATKVTMHESSISVLQTSVANLKNENSNLKLTCSTLEGKTNQLEQYSRRQSLRIEGIELKGGNEPENPDKIVEKVHNMMKSVGMNTPIEAIDRAHRIGKAYARRSDNVLCKSVIVKFVSFRHRTEFYRKRKDLDKNNRVRIDLTKSNYQIFSHARNLINEKGLDQHYVFVDINCRIKIVDSTRGNESFVASMEEVDNFLALC